MNNIDICDEVQQNFIDSSYDTNNNRAFPDIRDGLKPGQRACLWEMYTKKYTSNKPHVKSAKISGGVAALWWPHGTTAIYETFARMSMPYINNVPEVDFHGSNGNQILGNDAIAADRYTEARLSKIIEDGMLANINKNTVDMILNFSEDEKWPKVLPALFPRLLVNGCQGIGVSIANTWIPHNFAETVDVILHYIKTNEVNNEYYPDFPTGGVIINKDELSIINQTGKGKVILEAKYKIENQEIDFYELPYQVYIEPLIEKIKEIIENGSISGIKSVINKSDKKKLSLVIECDKGINPEKVVSNLFALTPLRNQYNVNQVGMVSKTPKLRNLQDVLDVYITHNTECIKREHQYDYEKAIARINIIKGLLIAISNIDEVIEIIRNDNNPKETLKITFNLNEEQVQAILDMKLGRLSKLEKEKLESELQEKEELAEYCLSIISDENKQKDLLAERLCSLVSKYGDSRRTKVIQKQVIKVNGKTKEAKEIIPEDVVITLNADGYIKSIPIKNFRVSKRGSAGSSADTIIDTIKTNTTDMLVLFSSIGKMYRICAGDIQQCSMADKGTALGSILKLTNGEKITRLLSVSQDNGYGYLLFTTKKGLVKKTPKEEFAGTTRNINGIKATTLKDGDELQSIQFMNNEDIVLISHKGQSLRFDSALMTPSSKNASGVKGINIDNDDYVVSAVIFHNIEKVLVANEDGTGKRVPTMGFTTQGRGGKGTKCGTSIADAIGVNEDDMVIVIGEGKTITLAAKSISEASKTAKGTKLIKTGKITGLTKI